MNAKSATTASKNQELIEKIKADEAAKNVGKEKSAEDDEARKAQEADDKRLADEIAKLEAGATEPTPELKAAAAKAAAEIEGSERDAVDERSAWNMEVAELSQKAATKLRNIATDFPESTPDSHPVFGRAGFVFTVGDMRDLFSLRRMR